MKGQPTAAAWLAERSRPLRRRLSPERFKETYINQALASHQDATYLEIGVRHGESFRIAQAARKIGIDPQTTEEMMILRPGEEYFATTSDDFFATTAAQIIEHESIHVALIDGLHEFKQVLRDLFNLEPFMRRDGVVFLDDFNPRSSERASDTPTGGAWNGDVWKLAPFLAESRPDLAVWTVDADEGVGVIMGFGGDDARLSDFTDAGERCKHLAYAQLEQDRENTLRLIKPAEFGSILEAVAARGAGKRAGQSRAE